MKIELQGFASVSAEVRTLADLIEFTQYLQDRHIDPESELDWGSGWVWVDLKVHDVDWIQCGDHRPVKRPDGEWEEWSDVILITHSHDEQVPGQMTTDEVVEPQEIHHQYTDYDWPSRDRQKRMASEWRENYL